MTVLNRRSNRHRNYGFGTSAMFGVCRTTDDPAGGGGNTGDSGDTQDAGFPPATPLSAMTETQRTAYWKDKARKHEEAWKATNLTPERVAELIGKAERWDAMEADLASDADKKIAAAQQEAAATAAAKWVPQVVKAEFRAAMAGTVDPSDIDAHVDQLTGYLDLTKFMLPDGSAADVSAIRGFVTAKNAAQGTTPPARQGTPTGPSARGLGTGTAHAGASKPGQGGLDEAARRFGTKN